jgi:hypothetical protein
MRRGNYSTKYNPEKLRNMLLQGKDASEIMKEFHISPYTLKEHIFMLEKEDKKNYSVPGLFSPKQKYSRKANCSGGFCLSADLLNETGIKHGDTCEVIVKDGQIILQKNSAKTA